MEHEVLVDNVCQELEIQHLVFQEQTESLRPFLLYASEKKLNQGDLSEGTFVLNLIGVLCAILNRAYVDWQRISICHFIICSTFDKGYKQMLYLPIFQITVLSSLTSGLCLRQVLYPVLGPTDTYF